MIRKYNINGTTYEYDLDRISIRDAMMLKAETGYNLVPFSKGLSDFDPECVQAMAWLIQTTAGVKGPDGQPLKRADLDFDLLAFFADDEDEEPDGETDPPTEPPLTEPSSPSGTTPDSMLPEPANSTA
jgi:hypothetical protein